MKSKFVAIGGLIAAFLIPVSNARTFSFKLSNSVEITAIEEKFVPLEHHLSGCVAYQNCKVDGVIAIGSIGVPKSVLSSVVVKTGTKEYTLDTSGMFDPFMSPDGVKRNFGGFCSDENNCAFRAALGDAGGIHVAEWVIKNGKSWRTILSDSQDLVGFFFEKQNLTPPKYN